MRSAPVSLGSSLKPLASVRRKLTECHTYTPSYYPHGLYRTSSCWSLKEKQRFCGPTTQKLGLGRGWRVHKHKDKPLRGGGRGKAR